MRLVRLRCQSAAMRSRVGVGLGEVITGVEEEDGDVGPELTGEPEEENVFGLEGAGEAGFVLGEWGELGGQEGANVIELSLELRRGDL